MLHTLQQSCTDHLATQEFFSDSTADTPVPISVFSEVQGDLSRELDIRLGKLGVCVVVLTPRAEGCRNEVPGLMFERIGIEVRVVENSLINRGVRGTQQPASHVAWAVAYSLKDFSPGTADVPLELESITPVEDRGLVAYAVRFRLEGGSATAPDRMSS